MTEPRGEERPQHDTDDMKDDTKSVSGPGGDSPDPEFGDDATIPDQET